MIADNVGDNVGKIAGMGADLYSSFAISISSVLVLSSVSRDINFSDNAYTFYPLVIVATGILVCMAVSISTLLWMTPSTPEGIDRVLLFQLILSSVIMPPMLWVVSSICLPRVFSFESEFSNEHVSTHN